MMNPPARLFFNVLQMNSGSETIPVFIDEPDHFRRLGPGREAKKLTQPSATHWYLEAGDFHGVAWHFRQPNLQAQVLGCFPHDGQA
ncbi:hypothetical protein QPX50_09260 [Corynebacterium accolens]|uniref:hypothetical protein n=1 Tax=Corynebacterium accolens TaxID=38284 RepID=UPI002543F2FC|nr:hypothetical protein [Corynebacterium accolens]MDK4331091.1 hypothetical protein [Corynebacterium accolens]